jgi:hypothetical protein
MRCHSCRQPCRQPPPPTVVWVLSAGAGYAELGLSLPLPLPATIRRGQRIRVLGLSVPLSNRAFVWAVSAYPLPRARAVT